MTPFQFLLVTLGAYRLTRLVIFDTIFDGPRYALGDWLISGGRFRRWVAELLGCQWCVGVHVAFWMVLVLSLVTGWWSSWTDVVAFGVTVLAVAAGQSFVHLIEDRLSTT
ncbi:MAG: DUF1360 domain-containing protein [Microthrixaceae bacterium]